MNILISHAYARGNKGDAALLSVLISDIRRAFGNPTITILSLDEVEPGETFEGVPVKHAFMYLAGSTYRNPLMRILYGFFVASSTMVWAMLYRWFSINLPLPKKLKEIIDLYRDTDLIIPVGGGYIRAQKGIGNTSVLFFILHPFFFSSLLGKITINYTQSVGPFGNRFQELMARAAVRRLDGIIVRERISEDLLKKWGIQKNVFVSVDSGFSFAVDSVDIMRDRFSIPKDRMLIGVTVRDWLPRIQQRAYEKIVAELCDYIIEKYGAFILFIPQVTVPAHHDDDRESGSRVFGYMRNHNSAQVLMEDYDLSTIKSIYGELDYLIGTRFHSVIFSLTSGIPTIAIGYEYKTIGIMTDLGLQEWVVDIRSVDLEKIKAMFDGLVSSRDSFRRQLQSVLPGYIERSNQSIVFVKKLYEQLTRHESVVSEIRETR